nr:GNAT family N-acetyltransferase [Gammaproteobacteria bacterium]
MNFPEIATERLLLTRICTGDSPHIYRLFADSRVVEYYDLEAFNALAQAEELIEFFSSRFESETGIRWAIRIADSNELIGTCGYNSWSAKMRNAVIGYDLNPAFWGNGYASEAVGRIIEAAFSGALACGQINRIQADTVPGNNASENLLVNLGFKEEGLRRESGYWKGRYHDLKCFGLLRAEFQKNITKS